VTQRYIHRQADAINRVFGTPQPPLGTKLGTPRKWKEEVDLGNQESDDAQVRIVSGLVGAGRGNRTPTGLLGPADFKSAASANFAIPARAYSSVTTHSQEAFLGEYQKSYSNQSLVGRSLLMD
jgi:hypothetical protein